MNDVMETPAQSLAAHLDVTARRVAPVWPLASFVAVNPFLGLADMPFGEACALLAQVGGDAPLPPRDMLAEALASGRIAEADLAAAIAAAGSALSPGELRAIARTPRAATPVATAALTVADVLDTTLGTQWSRFTAEQASKWCAAALDDGQASWGLPWRGKPLYAAWRAAALHDRTPEVMGLPDFRRIVAALPMEPRASIAAVLANLGIAPDRADAYLQRVLLGTTGWAGALRQRGWLGELAGEANDAPLELLAVRLAYEQALHLRHPDAAYRAAWSARVAAPLPLPETTLEADLLLLDAFERGYQRELTGRMLVAPVAAVQPPVLQAAFCIDVRSEVYRRALEAVTPEVQTIGFAGFFGFAMEYVRLGDRQGTEQCPVLLRPGFVICEAVQGASPAEEEAIAQRRGLLRRVADLWRSFRGSAVSSFAHVETAGFLAAGGLVRGTLGLTRRKADGIDPALLDRLTPSLDARPWQARAHGFAAAARLDAAEGVLRAMSLTAGFAPVVLLCGHGSSTVNNPHAAGLDCGACGGNTGESNARVAAAVLNDPAVRAGLAQRGIHVPEGTRFVAALHDTTTDEVRLYDAVGIDPRILAWLAEASGRTRAERAGLLGLDSRDPHASIARRSSDWSEVRPEWGLANNAAFIVAPRERTQGLDLGGRAFLHSYDWTQDSGFGVLELIMTAPMVVANWINLQYYGSTVDNAAMGSGNKVLHNIVGRIGVLEGQGGDLRPGLPMQSLHDGTRWMHEPMRLSVIIAAPEAAMEAVLTRHAGVRQLVENGWLHLFSLGEGMRRYRGPGVWVGEGRGPACADGRK